MPSEELAGAEPARGRLGSWVERSVLYPPPLQEPLLTLLYSIESNMKVLELLRPQWRYPMAGRIDASAPLQLASALSVSLAPTLYDAKEACQEVEKKRRKEDLAIEESVKEVLA
jgi:hypothetical protein